MKERLRFRFSLPATVGWGIVLAAAVGVGHPTDEDLRAAIAERKACVFESTSNERVDPIQIGMSTAELLALRADSLRESPRAAQAAYGVAEVESEVSGFVDEKDGKKDAGIAIDGEHPELDRWTWEDGDGIRRVEYELWQDRIYRIRWRLTISFERPVLDEYVRRATICFGTPAYDQTFEAEPGSTRATLRRIAWNHGDRRIELRQLHPLRGGPVYLTVTRVAALREIAEAGVVRYPDPERSESWWKRPTAPPVPATRAEREELGRQFTELLSQIDH